MGKTQWSRWNLFKTLLFRQKTWKSRRIQKSGVEVYFYAKTLQILQIFVFLLFLNRRSVWISSNKLKFLPRSVKLIGLERLHACRQFSFSRSDKRAFADKSENICSVDMVKRVYVILTWKCDIINMSFKRELCHLQITDETEEF